MKNNKFVTTLNKDNKDIKAARSLRLADEIESELDALITAKRKVLNTIKGEIDDLTDFAPNNTYSLKPGKENFKADEWVNRLHKAKVNLRIAQVEFDEAVAIKTEWFTEEEKA